MLFSVRYFVAYFEEYCLVLTLSIYVMIDVCTDLNAYRLTSIAKTVGTRLER